MCFPGTVIPEGAGHVSAGHCSGGCRCRCRLSFSCQAPFAKLSEASGSALQGKGIPRKLAQSRFAVEGSSGAPRCCHAFRVQRSKVAIVSHSRLPVPGAKGTAHVFGSGQGQSCDWADGFDAAMGWTCQGGAWCCSFEGVQFLGPDVLRLEAHKLTILYYYYYVCVMNVCYP